MTEATTTLAARDSSPESLPVRPGDVLAGRFRVERVLGSGGMGVVVAATHLDLGQLVALKFLLPAALNAPEAVARFLREARATVQIASEHVARVTDVGRLENDAPYLVMEYLAGTDLAALAKGTALPVESSVDFVLQACEAIAIAHSLGIVHRDLKPANLFLTVRPDGSPLVKVLDFGVSKLLELHQEHVDLTRTRAVLGSPLYMSPEQIESARNVDTRTDIWALGTILHELLTGTPPFQGNTVGAVFAAVLKTEPPRLTALRQDVPKGLEQVVLKALGKHPEQRFTNVAELALALAEFAPPSSRISVDRIQRVSEPRTPLISPQAERAPSETPPGANTRMTWESARKRPLVRAKVTTVGMVVLGALFAALALVRARPSPGNAAPSDLVRAATAPNQAANPVLTPKPREAVPPPALPTEPRPVSSASGVNATTRKSSSASNQRAAETAGPSQPAHSSKIEAAVSSRAANPLRMKFK